MAPGNPARAGRRASFPRLALPVIGLVAATVLNGADWPGWRGIHRDGITAETLPAKLPPQPAPRWRTAVGHGYASPLVVEGKVLVCEESNGQETARALDAASGRELWRTPYAPSWSDEFEPGPRCTPLVDRGLVFVQSAQGDFACLSLGDGHKLWGVRFADLGMVWVNDRHANIGAAVRRGHTGSPAVAGERVILQVGSTQGAAIVAFDRRSGRQLWKSLDDATSYSSPVVATLAGREQFVTATCEGLVGLDAADGALLWRVPFRTGANRNVLTPVIDGDSVLFASHTTGLRRVTLRADGARQAATEDWFNRNLRINLSTPVSVGGHLYGLGPARDFVCVNAADGKQKWSEPGFGAVAQVIAGGGRLLVQLDTGEVRLLRATPEAYEELGRFQACGKTYSLPAWSDGVLYVRDPMGCAAYALAGK
jgi:outer membrane protein assembly factor BamB